MVGLLSGKMGAPKFSSVTYQTGEGNQITVGDPVALLPENLKPLYAQLRQQGCQAIETLVAQFPPHEQSTALRRLLLAYAQEVGLSPDEKSRILAIAKLLLGTVDQNSIEWYLAD